MWLYNYLDFRAELTDRQIGPQTSLEALVEWSTFCGLRTHTLRASSDCLKAIHIDYMKKYDALPQNILTRAMMLFGLALGPFASVPIICCDAIALLSMFVVLCTCWMVGGAVTLCLGGAGWVFGGTKASDAILYSGYELIENVAFMIMFLLGIPAAAMNLIGLIPSVILEVVTEGLNYLCVAAVSKCTNPNQDSSKPTETDVEANTAPQAATTQAPITHAYNASNRESLVDVARETLPAPRVAEVMEARLQLSAS